MNNKIRLIPVLSTLLVSLAGCSSKPTVNCITFLDDYIYEIDEYKTLDYEKAKEFYAKSNDNWGGGCSAVSKVIDGKRLIGRNMDLNISNKCAYVVRTDITDKEPGTYKTMGLTYTFRDFSPDFEDVKKNGISKEFYDVAPFMCDDVMNTEGFHIEINMRNAECWPNGEDMFAVDHTNKNSKERIYMFELPQYLALHCKTVKEAKALVSSLDIYSKNGYWNYCFLVSDATGDSELLEFCFAYNEIIGNVFWIPQDENGVTAQTNFYRNPYGYIMQDIKSGEGRLKTIMDNINTVTTRKGLFDLMKKIQYSSFYLPYWECKNEHFDPRSENVGTFWGSISRILLEPEFEDAYAVAIDEYTSPIRNMSRQEKQNINEYWESTFTELVDPVDKTIQVRFFENENKMFKVSFSGTTKISEIA